MDLNEQLEFDLIAMKRKDKKIKKALGNTTVYEKIQKDFSKYNVTINPLKIKYGRDNVVEVIVRNDKFGHKDFSRKRIMKLGNELSQTLHEQGITGILTNAINIEHLN
jgi:predicted alpha/beta hydrolase family esterase